MSRATWYRMGKPTEQTLGIKKLDYRQKHFLRRTHSENARTYGSIRSSQRAAFVFRYGIRELWLLYLDGAVLRIGMLAEVARWEEKYQRQFVDRLMRQFRHP
jgi:hypothetical protein